MNNRLVAGSTAKTPAAIKRPNRWKMLNRLAADADELVEMNQEAWTIQRGVMPSASLIALDKAASWLRDFDEYGRELTARCRAMRDDLDPEDFYDDGGDGDLKREVIADRLALFVGSFPGGVPNGDPEAYCAMMLEHITAIDELRFVALDDACREVAERPKDFAPGPGQLIAAIREKQKLWEERLSAADVIEGRAKYIAAQIERLRPQIEARETERRVEEAQYDLNAALARVKRERDELAMQQGHAAEVAQRIANGFARLAAREAEVEDAARKLADANAGPLALPPPKDCRDA